LDYSRWFERLSEGPVQPVNNTQAPQGVR